MIAGVIALLKTIVILVIVAVSVLVAVYSGYIAAFVSVMTVIGFLTYVTLRSNSKDKEP